MKKVFKSYDVLQGPAKGKTIERASERWALPLIASGHLKEKKQETETKELKTSPKTKGRPKNVRPDSKNG